MFDFGNALEILSDYASSEGYEVDLLFAGISYVKFLKDTLNAPKSIKIEAGSDDELRTYFFLHELGHHELRKDWSRFTELLPVSAKAEEEHLLNKDVKYLRRVGYYVSSLEEEFLAWAEGLRLAKRLGIDIDEVVFFKLKAKCLKLYINYYGKK